MNNKLTFRVFAYTLIILGIVVGSTSVGRAASCWWYYHGRTQVGPAAWVGPFVQKETAMSEARGAKILSPSATIYVFNRCTGEKFSTNGAPLSSSQENRPSSNYVGQLRNLYKKTKQLLDWAYRNRGRLSDSHVDIINKYVDTYNTRIAHAKRYYPSTFGGWGSAVRINNSFKRAYSIYFRHRNSSSWTRINTVFRGEAATRNALAWYRRNYPDYYFAAQ